MTTEDQIKQIQELWNQEAIAGGEGQCCQLYQFFKILCQKLQF